MKPETEKLIADFFSERGELSFAGDAVMQSLSILLHCFRGGGKLLACGNGGSSADCDHIVGELMKGFCKKRPLDKAIKRRAEEMFGGEGAALADGLQQGLPAISLTCQTALMTAFINDCNADYLYAQQVNALMKPDDVLIALSTSGNSENVLHAVRAARVSGGKVIALTGAGGGKLRQLVDCAIVSPSTQTYKIQQDHIAIYHLLCLAVENELFDT